MKLGKENQNPNTAPNNGAAEQSARRGSTKPQRNRSFGIGPGTDVTNLRQQYDKDVHVARRVNVKAEKARLVPLAEVAGENKAKAGPIPRDQLPLRSSSLPNASAGKKGDAGT